MRQGFPFCIRALLLVALAAGTPGAASAEANVRLDVVKQERGGDAVRVTFADWPGAVWTFRAPEYLTLGNRIYGPLASTGSIRADGSVTLRGTNAQPDSAEFEFILTPGDGTVDVNASIKNAGTVAWGQRALGLAILESDTSPEFSWGRTNAFFDDKLTTQDQLEVQEHTTDPFTYDGGTVLPRDRLWFQQRRHAIDIRNRTLVVRTTTDGTRHVAIGFENAHSVSSTPGRPVCLRITPHFGSIGVGRSGTVRGRIYFFRGTTGALARTFKSAFRGRGPATLEPAYDSTHSLTATVRDRKVDIAISRSRSGRAERVILFRRPVPDLRFGSDEEQVVTHLDTTGSVAIKTLRIPGRVLRVSDDDVQPARTYAYWIRSPNGRTRPVAVRVRDDRVWWGKREVDSAIDAIARAYPGRVEVEPCGHTTQGWEIRGLCAGNRDTTVALIGGIHAGESGPEILLPLLERLMEEEGDLLDDVGIAVLPLVNADERQKLCDGNPWYLRGNPAGVDINRNFDANWDIAAKSYRQSTADSNAATYRGPTPESESETRAVVLFITRTHPAVELSFHGLTSVTGPRFVTAVNGSPEYYRRSLDVARIYQHGYFGDSGNEEEEPAVMRASVSGSLALWVSLRFDVPAADLESMPSPVTEAARVDLVQPEQLNEVRERHYQAVKRLLEFLREQQWGTSGQ